uniref:Uncharacterized protein n=1 Tax=Caenorhabditis japonica TaxID=281687 RepID=A0A8R1E9Y4_CAEJA
MVITEALEVRNTNLFESMNQSSFVNVKNVIKALNSLTALKNNDVIKHVTMDLKKIA